MIKLLVLFFFSHGKTDSIISKRVAGKLEIASNKLHTNNDVKDILVKCHPRWAANLLYPDLLSIKWSFHVR